MLISVVICTYNRSELLDLSLKSVIRQDFAEDDYEIIVVDNNSTDDTKAVVLAVAASSTVRISYLFENRQGLSYARNRGLEMAQGEIVVFTDDDIEAEPQWLRELAKVFQSAEVACVGGPIRPLWPHEIPHWLSDDFHRFLTVSEFESARESGSFTSPNYPWGANIAFRKEVFKKVGLFPTELGRIGNILLSNEEIDLCRKIERAGKKIGFAPQAVIHHKIPPNRLTKLWFFHRTFYQGVSDAVLDTGTNGNAYSRLRPLVSNLLEEDALPEGLAFNRKCRNRITLGYLHGMLSTTCGRSKFASLRFAMRFLSLLGSELTARLSNNADAAQWALALSGELEAKNERVAGLQRELEDRTAWALALKEKDQQKDTRIVELQQELADRTEWAMTLKSNVEQKDARILALQQELLDRTNWALKLRDEVQQKDSMIIALQEELAKLGSWATKLQNDLEKKSGIV
ncbi:MAG TPA: glycosyltransferase [Geomonas sp.]|nr:glycosyltransferase [Geomonas sp.]